MESALVFCISNEVWPHGQLCSADVLLASLKVCIKLDVRYSCPPSTETYKNTHASYSSVNVELFYSAYGLFLSSALFFGAFQRGMGNVNVQMFQMFHFVLSFDFKNLCTMFYKKDCVDRFWIRRVI